MAADIVALAGWVAEARLAGRRLAAPPRRLALRTLEEGYEVQDRANTILEARLGPRVGHKIGGTTEAMRAYINTPEPVGGEVFARTVHASGAVLRLDQFLRLGIETEIAVRLGKALRARPAPYQRDQVADAVESVAASIELVEDRYEDFRSAGAPLIIADNAFDAGVVLGEPVRDWRELPLDRLRALTLIDGRLVAEGQSDALMGHPLDALCWLANRRARLGHGLEAGSFVTLGTITPVQWIEASCGVAIEIEALGRLELQLVA
jgi:2-keto-4-pentenoate hydratase